MSENNVNENVAVGGYEVEIVKAKKEQVFKIGTAVKLLKKDYSRYNTFSGVIVGIDNFAKLPTITVLYLETDYSEAHLKFAYINSQSEDIEIIHMNKDEKILFDKDNIIERMDNEVIKREKELADAKAKKVYFEKHFNKYIEGVLPFSNDYKRGAEIPVGEEGGKEDE